MTTPSKSSQGTKMEEYSTPLTAIIENLRAAKLDPHPGYQRNFIWSQKKASKLVESVLVDRYIAPILVHRTKDPTSTDICAYVDQITDGKQRVLSLSTFSDKWDPFVARNLDPQAMLRQEWKLMGLLRRPDLNGLTYSRLPEADRAKLQNYKMKVVSIEGADKEELIDIFTCLNEATTGMNAQELRHAIYSSGTLNKLLQSLSSRPDFLKLLRKVNDSRMIGAELVLRFLAFFRNGVDVYIRDFAGKRAGLSKFLDAEMQFWSANYSKEASAEFTRVFSQAVYVSGAVFGDIAFSKTDTTRGAVSVVAFEVLMQGFALYKPATILEKKAEIRERFLDMCQNDTEFRDGIDKSTSDAPRVAKRHTRWGLALEEILGSDAVLPATILGNPTTMIATLTSTPRVKKKTSVEPSLPATVQASTAGDFFDPEDDPNAQLASELEPESLPLAVKEIPQEDTPSLASQVIAILAPWSAEDRVCDQCGGSITDEQLPFIVCKRVGELDDVRYTHAPGACDPVWLAKAAAAMAEPVTGVV